MYSSNKRKKELARKKKQEEKRMKRQKDSMQSPVDSEGIEANNADTVSSDTIPEPTSD